MAKNKLDRTEMEAIKTIIKSKVDLIIQKREQERHKKYKTCKEELEKVREEINNYFKTEYQAKADKVAEALKVNFPEYHTSPSLTISINAIYNYTGQITVGVQVRGSMNIDFNRGVSADLSARFIYASKKVEDIAPAIEVKNLHQQVEVLLAEIILTDRKNIMKRIDDIVKKITEG
jgi:membrane peptidoglycan carboxypeptidase